MRRIQISIKTDGSGILDKIKVFISLENGRGILYGKDRSILADVKFISEENQITVTDLTVKQAKAGYGTILMTAIMGVARISKKPVVLFAKLDSVEFYEKLGFVHITEFKRGSYRGQKLTVVNLRFDHPFDRQVSREDFIWIPPNVSEVFIYL